MIRRSGYDGGIDSQTRMPWMSNFRQFDRETGFLLPPSLDDWLPERHLARFVVEVIDRLDLSAMVKSYRGSGSAGYHPSCYWVFWFTAIRPGCFRAASWSGRHTIRWRSASSPPTIIPTTTPSQRFGVAFSRTSKRCSCGCWSWRARWACSRWARWDWTARKSTPMPAGTARCPMSMPARSRPN